MSPGPSMIGSGPPYGPSMNNMPGMMNTQGSPYPMAVNMSNNTSGKIIIFFFCMVQKNLAEIIFCYQVTIMVNVSDFLLGMSPGPDFGMDGKLNQAQKMNNKVEGTPKTESKSKVCFTFR